MTHQGTVKKLLPYALWDLAGIENWLNEQAKAGYVLVRWPGWTFMGWVYFRKDPQAVQIRYCLDPIIERISDIEILDRTASYEEFGWQYVCKISKLYAVYRCNEPGTPELYSDPESLSQVMEKQLRLAWVGLLIYILWFSVVFRNELLALFFRPEEMLMNLILRSDILIPLYIIMLIFSFTLLLNSIYIIFGIRKIISYLRLGQWPPANPRRYYEIRRNLMIVAFFVLTLLVTGYMTISGNMYTYSLPPSDSLDFPHVTLEETLLPHTSLRLYSNHELLHSNTFRHSLFAPEQYDIAWGGIVSLSDGFTCDTRIYQEYVRAASPALAQAVYRGRVSAHRHSLETYQKNWEKNTIALHPDNPNAYSFLQEQALSDPDLDALTCFSYLYSNSPSHNTVYIGLMNNQMFVLNVSGAIDSEKALSTLKTRLKNTF